MSAVEEYRDSMLGANPFCHKRLVDAAIAELEAALVDKQKEVVAALQSAVDMEAALAELNARRCEGCRYVVFDDDCQPFPWYCTCEKSMLHDGVTDPDFACNLWAACAGED